MDLTNNTERANAMKYAWVGLVVVCAAGVLAMSGAAPAEQGDPALVKLVAVREGLRSRLADKLKVDAADGRAGDYHLTLEEGADHERLNVILRRRGDAWAEGYGVVPWWRQETQKEKFSFLHRSGVQSTTRDKFAWEIDPAGLKLAEGRLSGTAEATFALDRTREQRMPTGGRYLMTTDGRWSLVDRWRITGHKRTRRQRYTLDARLLEGVRDVTLRLHDGIDGKTVTVQLRLPASEADTPVVLAPHWNASVHQVIGRELTFADGKLSGRLTVRFVPDPWYPRKAHHVRYTLDAARTPAGLSGTFKAEVVGTEDIRVAGQSKGRRKRKGPGTWEGAIGGRALAAVEGRYAAEGELGSSVGRVHGGFIPLGRFLEQLEAMKKLPAKAEPTRLYNDIRALKMALDHYPHALSDALAATRRPAPRWTEDAEDREAAYARKLAALAVAAGGAREVPPFVVGTAGPGDATFGPWYGSEPLGKGEDGVAVMPPTVPPGKQQWLHPPTWRVLGPFPQVHVRRYETPGLPDLVPVEGAGYAPDAEALGRDFETPEDGLIRWETTPAHADGTLLPPPWSWRRGKRTDEPGRADTVWYAASEIRSERNRAVWLAIRTKNHGALWVNDRLVWVDREREYGRHRLGRAVLRVNLVKGVNRLLVRCRDDRGGSAVRVNLCRNAGPASEAPAARKPREVRSGERWNPDASPPLAWDLEEGVNVAWSSAEGAGGSTPLVLPERVLVNTRDHELVCFDRDTGRRLWSAALDMWALIGEEAKKAYEAASDDKQRRRVLKEHLGFAPIWSESSPVSDGTRVFVHYGSGLLACYDLDGTRVWRLRTHMHKVSLKIVAGRLIVSGAAVEPWAEAFDADPEGLTGKPRSPGGHFYAGHSALMKRRKKDASRHGVMALDPKTGKPDWARSARGAYAGEPLTLAPGGGRAVLVTRGGEVLDAADGKRLLDIAPALGEWDWFAMTAAGDTLYSAWEGGRAAARLMTDAKGQLGVRPLWRGRRLHAYIAGGPNPCVFAGGRLFVWRRVPEHAKHCPAYVLQADWYHADTGRHDGWIKRVMMHTNRTAEPVVARDYLFCPDRRGGPHSGGEPPERQIAVVDISGDPTVVARNPAPNLSARPVFDGEALFLRTGDALYCVKVTDDAGRAYQAEQYARAVLGGIYPKPADADGGEGIAPAVSRAPRDCPVIRFSDGASIADWLAAGPFGPHEATQAPAELGTGEAVPTRGTVVRVGDVERKLRPLPRELVTVTTSFHNDGRMDDWQLRTTRHRIDVRPLAGDREDAVVYLFALLDNARERLVASTMTAPGMTAWIGGRKVATGEPVRLEPGLHPLLVRVQVDEFRPKTPQQPVDLPAAVKAGAAKRLAWPETWTVVGPVPNSAGVLTRKQRARTPRAVQVGEKRFTARELPMIGASLDFSALAGLKPDEKPSVGEKVRTNVRVPQGAAAYAFAEVDAPDDGTLLINASADWFMAWYVDGELVYSTLGGGNGRNPLDLKSHTLSVPVSKGRHTVAAMVKPGSKGWSLTSYAAWADADSAGRLHEKFPASGGVRQRAPEFRASPSLREMDLPEGIRAVWVKQVRDNRRRLERIIRERPDSEAAKTARGYLEAADGS